MHREFLRRTHVLTVITPVYPLRPSTIRNPAGVKTLLAQ